MQNLKIQTLWQLCQELKQKRQDMVEKLSHTQHYLDKQQLLMSSELLSLRKQNNELSSDLAQLYTHLETLRQAWHKQPANDSPGNDGNGGQAASLEAELEDLRSRNQELESENARMQAQQDEREQELLQPLNQLNQDYEQLDTRLNEVQDFLGTKETQLGVLLQTVQVIQREFSTLRDNNKHLSGDMDHLVTQTDQLIGLVETYRQAALAAVTDAGMQDEAEAMPAPEDLGSELEEDDGIGKADAVREAVRKKINALLRHKFGKLPRRLSNSLKVVTSNNRLDKIFDKALKAESLEEFESGLDA
ncbi:MAG: hypothetical protein ACAI44_04195 [Candidatus Sericytochromatia bacterium]